ncbi:hypothetical protein FGO68_gene8528 [Halteria grandinella]|uniref:N-acetyltransferase domain-containing protein n=1 Tax=Halteria grandinella TaxID=5974 RepID=A0A8J8NJM3_HALGN|nr:hypothetical protein FGO68_gene8528 [Halteria grandinella]
MEQAALYEDDLYLIRTPVTTDEITANQCLMVDCRQDNPIFKVSGFTREDILIMAESRKDWEIKHAQRFSIFTKATGELCGAFAVTRLSEFYTGFDDEQVKELSKKPYVVNFFKHIVRLDQLLTDYCATVFPDQSRGCLMHSFSVPAPFRGKGLASLMNKVSIARARSIGCGYVIAHMITPETRHLAIKTGFDIAQEEAYDEELYKEIVLGDRHSAGEFTEEQRARVEEMKARFAPKMATNTGVILDVEKYFARVEKGE